MQIAAQSIGLAAVGISILSFQCKSSRHIILMQCLSCFLFSVNLFMLGAMTGAILNLIGTFRAFVFANRKIFHADSKAWPVVFSLLAVGAYMLSFFVLGMERTPLTMCLEALPVIAGITQSVSFFIGSPRAIRLLGLVISPCWFVYQLSSGSIGGLLNEVICMASIFISLFRYRKKRKETAQPAEKKTEVQPVNATPVAEEPTESRSSK